ncbi:MAG: phosphoglycerate dehydrogenase [Chitinophagaceae bacterium]|nr:phosphoglycerate dehydrogenase [Chitinophagaceae bacterium]
MMSEQLTSYPKDKINILFLENLSQSAKIQFENAGYRNIRTLSGALSEEDLIKEIKNVHLLGIRSKTKITKRILENAPKLQAIGCFCIGVNQVDIDAATQKGIAVFNAPYSNTRSVAELVLGAAIMLIRRIPDKNSAAHKGIWLKEASNSYELRGKTIGIVGYGNIGTQVSILAEAFGMHVIYYDIVTRLPLGNAQSRKTLEELVFEADIVTLHIPDTRQTKNLINANVLSQFKKGSILINYARGEVVDVDALAEQLKSKRLNGAAIDVFPLEPEKSGDNFISPLQGLPNVLLTPHIGGSTEEAQLNIGIDVSQKLFNFLELGSTNGSHSVPEINLPAQEGTHRILHIHNNIPGVLSAINSSLSANHINILSQYLKTNEDIGYVVLDIDSALSAQAFELLKDIKGTIKVRMVY